MSVKYLICLKYCKKIVLNFNDFMDGYYFNYSIFEKYRNKLFIKYKIYIKLTHSGHFINTVL